MKKPTNIAILLVSGVLSGGETTAAQYQLASAIPCGGRLDGSCGRPPYQLDVIAELTSIFSCRRSDTRTNRNLMKITDATRKAVKAELARENGSKGGLATAAKMTAKQLSERGRKAVAQREANKAKRKSGKIPVDKPN